MLATTRQGYWKMQIDFLLGTAPATFRRSWVTGRSSVETADGTVELANPLDPRTHFYVGRTRSVAATVGEHDVVVTWSGPPLFRAFVPLRYRILVDGLEVATKTGY